MVISKNKVINISASILLLAGAAVKFMDVSRFMPVLFFSLGGILKLIYLIGGYRSGHLAGRFNLGLLFFGLLLLFLSIYLRFTTSFILLSQIILFTAISIKIFAIISMRRTAKIRNVMPTVRPSSTGPKSTE